jgi:hypothetical protein
MPVLKNAFYVLLYLSTRIRTSGTVPVLEYNPLHELWLRCCFTRRCECESMELPTSNFLLIISFGSPTLCKMSEVNNSYFLPSKVNKILQIYRFCSASITKVPTYLCPTSTIEVPSILQNVFISKDFLFKINICAFIFEQNFEILACISDKFCYEICNSTEEQIC